MGCNGIVKLKRCTSLSNLRAAAEQLCLISSGTGAEAMTG